MRPIIPTEPTDQPEEHFQNTVLRPILKQQHGLLVLTLTSLFPAILDQPVMNRPELIRQKIQKDVVLASTLTGMVLGQMNVEELTEFWASRSTLTKRLRAMLILRLIDALTNPK